MKYIVVDWLNDHLSDSLGVTEVTAALEKAGIEVESVSRPPEYGSDIVTATVKEVKPHPNADKLQLAMLDAGGETVQVVCGAPNLSEGQRVVLARPGAKLPGGEEIAATKIRGSESHGMLCSERELGLSKNHDGILELGDEVPADVPLNEVFGSGQSLIEIDTAPNRWELQSYRGIAIEVAAHAGVDVVWQKVSEPEVAGSRVENLFTNSVKEEVPCYGLVKLKLKGDKVPESPTWLQRYLRLQGVRPVNAIVDITNYVMFDTGQPLHAFDAGEINGQIDIRFAHDQEKLTTLDGVKRSLTSSDLVIADSKGAVALAGVMGGEASEISADTREVLLEGATFDGPLVRKTAQRHSLRTDASSRFERRIPVKAVKQSLRYAVHLLCEHADVEVSEYQNELNVWPWVQHIGVRGYKVSDLLGLEVDRNVIVDNLKKLHFDVDVFDIAEEARKHLGKPYRFGAKFKTDGTEAFDCSYLVDYLYSLIGVNVGHTALGQYELGEPVEDEDLRSGDVVFIEGKIDKSATTHYYTSDSEGNKTRQDLGRDKRVGHNGLYVGDGKVVMAAEYIYENGEWKKRKDKGVIEVDLEEFTSNPGYLGGRRYVDDLDNYVRVTAPWWRPDVKSEADIAEEVVKLIGLDKLPATIPEWRPGEVTPDRYWSRLYEIRQVLRGLGLVEVTTYPFISEQDIHTFRMQNEAFLKLQNPRSQEQSHLRRNLIPQIARSVSANSASRKDFGFFEIARSFYPQPEADLPQENSLLAIAGYHADSLSGVKNHLDQLMDLFNMSPEYHAATDISYLHPSRQAKIEYEGDHIGYYGEVHPEIAAELKLDKRLAVAELDINKVLQLWGDTRFQPPSVYQSSYRDLTILIPESATWQELDKTINELEGINGWFKDEFKRPEGRAITVHVELTAEDHTLTESEIDKKLEKLDKAIKRTINGSIEF